MGKSKSKSGSDTDSIKQNLLGARGKASGSDTESLGGTSISSLRRGNRLTRMFGFGNVEPIDEDD